MTVNHPENRKLNQTFYISLCLNCKSLEVKQSIINSIFYNSNETKLTIFYFHYEDPAQPTAAKIQLLIACLPLNRLLLKQLQH